MVTPIFDSQQAQEAFELIRPLCSRCLGQLAAELLPAALCRRAGEPTLSMLFVIGAALLVREMEP